MLVAPKRYGWRFLSTHVGARPPSQAPASFVSPACPPANVSARTQRISQPPRHMEYLPRGHTQHPQEKVGVGPWSTTTTAYMQTCVFFPVSLHVQHFWICHPRQASTAGGKPACRKSITPHMCIRLWRWDSSRHMDPFGTHSASIRRFRGARPSSLAGHGPNPRPSACRFVRVGPPRAEPRWGKAPCRPRAGKARLRAVLRHHGVLPLPGAPNQCASGCAQRIPRMFPRAGTFDRGAQRIASQWRAAAVMGMAPGPTFVVLAGLIACMHRCGSVAWPHVEGDA